MKKTMTIILLLLFLLEKQGLAKVFVTPSKPTFSQLVKHTSRTVPL
jgi:hypothetical protein